MRLLALMGGYLGGICLGLALLAAPACAVTCQQAVVAAEQSHAIPQGLLSAIAQVESGRRDPASGQVAPWPWTVNADGDGEFFDSAAQAVQFVRTSQAHDIDVGCMQISLLHHPNAFSSLQQAFDPVANAAYAADFLRQLYAQTNDWAAAAALYHSATPALAAEYRGKVMAAWNKESGPSPLARAWAATVGGGVTAMGSPFGGATLGAAPPARAFPSFAGQATGRGLASYRAMPITIVGFRRAG